MDGQLPAAGWYADPADPQNERWWDGAQWTDHTRPLATPVYQAPIPQFAGASESPWEQAATSTASADPYGGSTSTFSFDDRFDGGDPYSRSPGAESPSPGWYSQSSQPVYMTPPTNTPAIVGFVLSLLGISLGGIIGGAVGLRKAREFEQQGIPPVGRILARWAIGISIASIVIAAVLTVSAIAVFTAEAARQGVTEYTGNLGTATKETLELSATLTVTELTGERPIAVDCPSLIREDDGYFHCNAYMADGGVIDVSIPS